MVTSYQNHFSISYANLRKQMWMLIKFIYPEYFQHLKPMYRRTTVQLWIIFRLHRLISKTTQIGPVRTLLSESTNRKSVLALRSDSILT